MNKKLIVLLLSAIILPPAAQAAEPPLVMHYSLYAGGLGVVDLDMRYQLTETTYDLNAEGRTKNFWRALVPWRAHVQTRGKVSRENEVTVLPGTSIYDTIWREKLKSVRMDYDTKGDVTVTANPPVKKGGRVEATEEQIRGSIDPLGAVVTVLAKTTAGEPGCSGKIPAYDGRRRYDLVLNSKGNEDLKANRYSMYSGPAERCEISFVPVAGFPKKDERSGFWSVKDNETEKSPLVIWMARVKSDGPVLPVRLQSDGTYGTLVAHLQSIDPPAKAAETP